MMHQMRAEHAEAGSVDGVRSWHIVRGTETRALCGKALDAAAVTRSAALWTADPDLNCHTCGALLLREAPYLPDEHG